jgi:hypothetical protein
MVLPHHNFKPPTCYYSFYGVTKYDVRVLSMGISVISSSVKIDELVRNLKLDTYTQRRHDDLIILLFSLRKESGLKQLYSTTYRFPEGISFSLSGNILCMYVVRGQRKYQNFQVSSSFFFFSFAIVHVNLNATRLTSNNFQPDTDECICSFFNRWK